MMGRGARVPGGGGGRNGRLAAGERMGWDEME